MQAIRDTLDMRPDAGVFLPPSCDEARARTLVQSTSLPLLGTRREREQKAPFTATLGGAGERAPAICRRAGGLLEYEPASPYEHLSASATYLEAHSIAQHKGGSGTHMCHDSPVTTLLSRYAMLCLLCYAMLCCAVLC